MELLGYKVYFNKQIYNIAYIYLSPWVTSLVYWGTYQNVNKVVHIRKIRGKV